MIIRISVIGLLIPGVVLFGSSGSAETRTDPHPQAKHVRPRSAPVTVNVYGSDNTVAMDESVLAAGDDSRLNANTGDVSSSGTLGIDTDRSSLESGTTTSAAGQSPDSAQPARKPWQHGTAPALRAVEKVNRTEQERPVDTAPRQPSRMASYPAQGPEAEAPAPDRFPYPIPVSGQDQGQGTAISGYEDHSVRVAGEDHMAVYDDSNLFVNRNGQLNANTGDTDSTGLNAVDVSGSSVGSGNHTEGDELEDEREAASARWAGQPATSTGTQPRSNGPASSTVTDEGESRANGGSGLTIGADGYDDLGIDVEGKRNIATYDDSNVVVGGTGDVNAQIGDSDTSGAVVMGIDDSDVRSGNST